MDRAPAGRRRAPPYRGLGGSGAADVNGGGAPVGKGAAEDLLHLLRFAQKSQRLSARPWAVPSL